jgi:hypothetical protein
VDPVTHLPLITAWERIAEAFSRRSGVKVVLAGTQAKTDGKTIWLPGNIDHLSADVQALAEGMLDHEWLHVREEVRAEEGGYRSPLAIKGSLPAGARDIANWIEDVRIERAGAAEWEGVGMNLDACLDFCLARAAERRDSLSLWDDLKITLIAHARGHAWTPSETVEKLFSGPLRGLVPKVRGCVTAADVGELARDVWDTIEELFPVPPPPPPSGDGEDEGEDDESEGDGGEGSDGDPAEAGDGASGGDASGDGAEARPAGSDDGDGADELTEEERAEIKRAAESADGTSDAIDEVRKLVESASRTDREIHRRWMPHPDALARDRWVPGKGSTDAYFADRSRIMPIVGPLRAKLLAQLRVRARERWVPEQDEGELDEAALHLLAVPGASLDIHRRRIPGRPVKCAFATLVDCSGSMRSQSRDVWARRCAIAMAESLEPLGVPHLIVGFTNVERGGVRPEAKWSRWLPFHFDLVKSFDESLTAARSRFAALHAKQQNVDGEAVLQVARRLAMRPEPRKVLFVFSDGVPAGGGHGGEMEVHLRETVERVTANRIEVYGIGIQTDSVKRFYPRFDVVNDLHDLPGAVFALLKGAMR